MTAGLSRTNASTFSGAIVTGSNDSPPKEPLRCGWCRCELDDGERFRHEYGVQSLYEAEPSILEHDAVERFSGVVATCEACRTSIILNHEDVEAEAAANRPLGLTPQVKTAFFLFLVFCVFATGGQAIWLGLIGFAAYKAVLGIAAIVDWSNSFIQKRSDEDETPSNWWEQN